MSHPLNIPAQSHLLGSVSTGSGSNLTALFDQASQHIYARPIDLQTGPRHISGLEALAELLDTHKGLMSFSDSTGFTLLHHAGRAGHAQAVSLLISRGINLRALTHDGRTALHVAARDGQVSAVKALVQAIPDKPALIEYLNMQDKVGETALHAGVRSGDEKTVRTLVDHGADLHIRNDAGHTAAALAKQLGFFHLLVCLSVNEQNKKQEKDREEREKSDERLSRHRRDSSFQECLFLQDAVRQERKKWAEQKSVLAQKIKHRRESV